MWTFFSAVSDGDEISLVIELNLPGKALGVTLAANSQARIPIEKAIEAEQKMDLNIYFGSAGMNFYRLSRR